MTRFPIRHFQSPLLHPSDPARPEVPGELWQVADPPTDLYLQGKPEALSLLSRLPVRGLAVVGTRECQGRSLALVRRVLRELEGFDLIIVSGLARGIDREAHTAAL